MGFFLKKIARTLVSSGIFRYQFLKRSDTHVIGALHAFVLVARTVRIED